MTFEAHDPEEKFSEEGRERIEALADGILGFIYEETDSPEEVLVAIAAVASYIISEHAPSRAMAQAATSSLLASIASTIALNDADGNVNWNQRSAH
jgi:hypothetical protein